MNLKEIATVAAVTAASILLVNSLAKNPGVFRTVFRGM